MRQRGWGAAVGLLLATICGCRAPGTRWQQDCGAFVDNLAALASKASGSNTSGYGDQFKGKEVIWNLKFKEVKKDEKGEESIDFDLEPFGIKYKFFSGKPVMMSFTPAPAASDAWRATKPGSDVKVSAVVASVFFATMPPGDNPSRHVSTVVASLENVTIISSTSPVAKSAPATPTRDPSPRYMWQSKKRIPVGAIGLSIKGDSKGGVTVGKAPGGLGAVAFLGSESAIDTPGSSDIRIEIDPAVKKTTYAGLTFTLPCVLEILLDTTVLVDQEGIVAKDKTGKVWTSAKTMLDSKLVIAFFPDN